MEKCREWAVEVDQDQQNYDLDAQERFITDFIGLIYQDIESDHGVMSKISSLHFTRIFQPTRDNMGAYVRLRIFAEEADMGNIDYELLTRFEVSKKRKTIFLVKSQNLNWDDVVKKYGGIVISLIFRDHLASVSKTAYQLLCEKQKGLNIEELLWPWTHFYLNSTCGFMRKITDHNQNVTMMI